jgi:AcrR family transcriptional regulator
MPDSRRRLQDAALALYAEWGFAEVTAAAVADRAGLTERTFFRHFADKKEVLFGDEAALRDVLADAVNAAPADAPAVEAVLAGLEALAAHLQERRDRVVERAHVIARSPELRERELAKLAGWTEAVASALRGRGLSAAVSAVAAEASTATFRAAFRQWVEGPGDRVLADVVRDAFADLAGFARPDPPRRRLPGERRPAGRRDTP